MVWFRVRTVKAPNVPTVAVIDPSAGVPKFLPTITTYAPGRRTERNKTRMTISACRRLVAKWTTTAISWFGAARSQQCGTGSRQRSGRAPGVGGTAGRMDVYRGLLGYTALNTLLACQTRGHPSQPPISGNECAQESLRHKRTSREPTIRINTKEAAAIAGRRFPYQASGDDPDRDVSAAEALDRFEADLGLFAGRHRTEQDHE